MPSISPFPWFDSGAEEAARFYVGVFPDSRIVTITRYGLSWQVNPLALGENSGRSGSREVEEGDGGMLSMKKIEIAALKKTCDGGA
jgi:predicted 3-demethylubiquinone-9 3-methyltransferase (glyoxalase superfamily)